MIIERPKSPHAFYAFKNWEIEAKVGRLWQNFYKNLRRKLQQLKHALISSLEYNLGLKSWV